MGTILLFVTLAMNGEIRYHTYTSLDVKSCLEMQRDILNRVEEKVLYSECVNEGERY